MQDFIKNLSARFPTKDLGFPTSLLGYCITKTDSSCFSLSHAGYIRELVEFCGQSKGRPTYTPILGEHLQLANSTDLKQALSDSIAYNSIIGCLDWIVKSSHADISFAVFMLC
eukprot:Ihof_evm1s995 gene=Ihof_evmTU1s995